jgi:hypothetical protein
MKLELTEPEKKLLLILLGLLLAGSAIYYFRHNSLWTNGAESFKNDSSSNMETGFAPNLALMTPVSNSVGTAY